MRANEYLRLEARCIRLDGRGKVNRKEPGVGLQKGQNEEPCVQWPNRGFYCFNLFNSIEFSIPKKGD